MNPRKSCESCRDGVPCRVCGGTLRPAPELLCERDYELMLALIDGSDRKYAPTTLEAVRAVFGVSETTTKSALHKLRLKLRRLLQEAERQDRPAARTEQTTQVSPETLTRKEILRRFRVGVLSPDEAERLLAGASMTTDRKNP